MELKLCMRTSLSDQVGGARQGARVRNRYADRRLHMHIHRRIHFLAAVLPPTLVYVACSGETGHKRTGHFFPLGGTYSPLTLYGSATTTSRRETLPATGVVRGRIEFAQEIEAFQRLPEKKEAVRSVGVSFAGSRFIVHYERTMPKKIVRQEVDEPQHPAASSEYLLSWASARCAWAFLPQLHCTYSTHTFMSLLPSGSKYTRFMLSDVAEAGVYTRNRNKRSSMPNS